MLHEGLSHLARVLFALFEEQRGNSHVVATHRPESLEWGAVGNLGADIMQGIRRVKPEDSPRPARVGSSTLTSVLLE
jgi:hypothetical protein